MMMCCRFSYVFLTTAVLLLMRSTAVQAQTALADKFALNLLSVVESGTQGVDVTFTHSAEATVTFNSIQAYSFGCKSANGIPYALGDGLTTSRAIVSSTSTKDTLVVDSTITSQAIYDSFTSTVSFCLYATVSANGVVANVLEVPIDMKLTTDGTIESFTFNGNARAQAADQQADVQVDFITLQASLCDGAASVTQSQQLAVCIINPFFTSVGIADIKDFVFSAIGGTVTQDAVVNGFVDPNFSQWVGCSNSGGTETCRLNTFLAAAFFDGIRTANAAAGSAATASVPVTASGKATMATFRRHLQETGDSDAPKEGIIEFSFELQVPEDTSDAKTNLVAAALAVATMGATAVFAV